MLLIIQMFIFFPSSHMEVTGIWFTKRLFSRLKVVIVFVAAAQKKHKKNVTSIKNFVQVNFHKRLFPVLLYGKQKMAF